MHTGQCAPYIYRGDFALLDFVLQFTFDESTFVQMFGVDGRRVISKVILSSVEGSHLLMPSVCLFDIGVVCFYNMTDIRSDDHYNSDESVPGYSFGR